MNAIEKARQELGSIDDLLKAAGHPSRGKNYRCLQPEAHNNGDRNPSAYVRVSKAGVERLTCPVCGWWGDVIDVARKLGTSVPIGGGKKVKPKLLTNEATARLAPDEREILNAIAFNLAHRDQLPLELQCARVLSELSFDLIDQDVLRNLDYFRSNGLDPVFVWDLARLLRSARGGHD